jgi:RNA polymerase-binding transcription factor DksA
MSTDPSPHPSTDPMAQQARQMLLGRRASLRAQLGEGLALQERRELAEVEGALARIAAGHFGACERCGGAIGRQRLRAVPEARLCLGCASTAPEPAVR